MGGHYGESGIENTGGVRPVELSGRLREERERTSGMTPEEREWRRRYINDQKVGPPRKVEALKKEFMNPIRRFYRFPLDMAAKAATPFVGEINATVLRFYFGRIAMGVWIALGVHYYFKYNTNTWEERGRWRVIQNESAVYPSDPGYPYVARDRKPYEYYDRGFSKSIFAKDYAHYQEMNQHCKK